MQLFAFPALLLVAVCTAEADEPTGRDKGLKQTDSFCGRSCSLVPSGLPTCRWQVILHQVRLASWRYARSEQNWKPFSSRRRES
jgi:hypothetical protein